MDGKLGGGGGGGKVCKELLDSSYPFSLLFTARAVARAADLGSGHQPPQVRREGDQGRDGGDQDSGLPPAHGRVTLRAGRVVPGHVLAVRGHVGPQAVQSAFVFGLPGEFVVVRRVAHAPDLGSRLRPVKPRRTPPGKVIPPFGTRPGVTGSMFFALYVVPDPGVRRGGLTVAVSGPSGRWPPPPRAPGAGAPAVTDLRTDPAEKPGAILEWRSPGPGKGRFEGVRDELMAILSNV